MSFPNFIKALYERFVNSGLQLFRKLSGEDIKKQKKEQEEFFLRDLLRVIEHDIRHPLATIRNLIDFSIRKFSNYPEIVRTLESIGVETNEIGKQISLISLARLDKLPSDRTLEINLRDFVNSVIKHFKQQNYHIYSDNLIIYNEIEAVFIKGIPNLLETAFLNILLNQLENTEAKRNIIKIRGFSDESRKNVIIEVSCDYGKVKEGFFITENLKLFVAEKIIEIHSGKMDIKSNADKIELISVSLPRYFTKKMRKLDEEKENSSHR